MNKKIIAPILTVGAAFACAVGTTFALFTHNANSKIEINAGIVQVDLSSQIQSALSRYTDTTPFDAVAAAEGTGYDAVFENGGTASVSTDPVTQVVSVALDRFAPMDQITVKMTGTNSSNINIKWQYKVVLDGELIPALDIIANGQAITTTQTHKEVLSNWSDVVVPTETPSVISETEFVVSFPNGGDADNQYQGKSCTIEFSINAVQGNATVENPRVTDYGFYDSYEVSDGPAAADSNAEPTTHWVHEISNVEEFRNIWMDAYYASKSEHYPGYLDAKTQYVLVSDVDFAGETTYGNDFATWQSFAFTGKVDGNGHTIKNIVNDGTYAETDAIGGMFAFLGRPVAVSNLTFDNVKLIQKNSDKGIGLIGGCINIQDSGAESLVIDDVDISALCSIESSQKTGGFVGCCRGYTNVTIKNCINNGTIVTNNQNCGGFLGTSSYSYNFHFENDVFNGKILSTASAGIVGGFVSQAQSANSITIKNCQFTGELDNRAGGSKVSWFISHRKDTGTFDYSDNMVSGIITVKNLSNVTEKDQTGIAADSGALIDKINVVSCGKVDMSFDETTGDLLVSPVANADHYEVKVSLSCLKGTITGDTFTQVYDSDYVYDFGSFNTVEDLKSVKLITRVGHVLPTTVTKFNCHYDCQGISSNHYRLDSKGSYTTDVPSVETNVKGMYVVFGNENELVNINYYETVWMVYNVVAVDANNTALASSSWRIGGSSASPFMNMAGAWYRGSAPHYTPIIL